MGLGQSDTCFDDKFSVEENIARVYGSFAMVNYQMIKDSVLPIITEKPKSEHKKIYEDKRLPAPFREKMKDFETYVEREMNIVTFIGIWMFWKLPINFWQNGNIFTGVSLFNRHVLALAIPTWALGFGFVKENLIGRLNFLSIEEVLFDDKKNDFISMYRKRLVEKYPDFASRLYTTDKKWLARDGVDPFLFQPLVFTEGKNKSAANPEETSDSEEQLTETEQEYLKTLALNNSNKG